MIPMREEELLFFTGRPGTLALYQQLRSFILTVADVSEIQVKKTQISFKSRYTFAVVSFTPVRRAAQRPPVWLTLSLGLRERINSPRVDAAAQVRPLRWTNHITIDSAAMLDGELAAWIAEAALLSSGKS